MDLPSFPQHPYFLAILALLSLSLLATEAWIAFDVKKRLRMLRTPDFHRLLAGIDEAASSFHPLQWLGQLLAWVHVEPGTQGRISRVRMLFRVLDSKPGRWARFVAIFKQALRNEEFAARLFEIGLPKRERLMPEVLRRLARKLTFRSTTIHPPQTTVDHEDLAASLCQVLGGLPFVRSETNMQHLKHVWHELELNSVLAKSLGRFATSLKTICFSENLSLEALRGSWAIAPLAELERLCTELSTVAAERPAAIDEFRVTSELCLRQLELVREMLFGANEGDGPVSRDRRASYQLVRLSQSLERMEFLLALLVAENEHVALIVGFEELAHAERSGQSAWGLLVNSLKAPESVTA